VRRRWRRPQRRVRPCAPGERVARGARASRRQGARRAARRSGLRLRFSQRLCFLIAQAPFNEGWPNLRRPGRPRAGQPGVMCASRGLSHEGGPDPSSARAPAPPARPHKPCNRGL